MVPFFGPPCIGLHVYLLPEGLTMPRMMVLSTTAPTNPSAETRMTKQPSAMRRTAAAWNSVDSSAAMKLINLTISGSTYSHTPIASTASPVSCTPVHSRKHSKLNAQYSRPTVLNLPVYLCTAETQKKTVSNAVWRRD